MIVQQKIKRAITIMITSDNKKYNASLPCKKLSLGIS
jgi:hypothetical protein